MGFGSYRISEKASNNRSFWRVQTDYMSKRCLESSSTLHKLFIRETKALARSCVLKGSSEPSPHADVIRTTISCAGQFIVLIFHCGTLFYFLIQYYNLNS